MGRRSRVPANAEPSAQTNFYRVHCRRRDTNIQFATNAVTGTATKADLGASFARNNGGTWFYEFSIYVRWGSPMKPLVGLSLMSARSSMAPSPPTSRRGTLLAPQVWISNGSTLAAATLHIQSISCKQDN